MDEEVDEPAEGVLVHGKRFTNQLREYWYMGSMMRSSDTQKKSSDPRTAYGMYLGVHRYRV